MSDRRVVRGNTYSGAGGVASTSTRIRRRELPGRGAGRGAGRGRPSLPRPRLSLPGPAPLPPPGRAGRPGGVVAAVAGRRHQDLQTEPWLEELGERREEREVGQTTQHQS